jgi:hypothetical protein
MSEENHQQLLLLGEIKGIVQGLKGAQEQHTRELQQLRTEQAANIGLLRTEVNGRFERIDERLRAQEQRSAVIGAASGGAMSIGVALIVEGIRQWLKRGGTTP